MRRVLAISGVLIMLLACGGGAWLAVRPPIARFVLAGAQDVQVEALHGELQISYRVVELRPAWYVSLGRQLEQQGWLAIEQGRNDGLKAVYMRETQLPVGRMREWVYMAITEYSDPHVARIRVRRWIELPWGWLARL
jgi:hypothetical protein